MAVFDFYNGWESALHEAASRKSIQEIVDLGCDLLGNPVLVTDIDGNILSMLLGGKEVDGRLLKYLEHMLQSPWQLFVLQNLDRNDAVYLNTQIKHLHERDPQCICAIHDGCVVGLTAADRARSTVDSILQTRGAQRWPGSPCHLTILISSRSATPRLLFC